MSEEFEKMIKDLSLKSNDTIDKLALQMIRKFGYEGGLIVEDTLNWLNENEYELEMETQDYEGFNTKSSYYLRVKDGIYLAMFTVVMILDLKEMKFDIICSDVYEF